MKICWDNLEGIKFTKNHTFRSLNGKREYIEKDRCKTCGDFYLDRVDCDSAYCCHRCSRIGKSIPNSVRKKISKALEGRYVGELNSFYGKKHSDNTKLKWLETNRQFGDKNHRWLDGKSVELYCDVWRDKEYKKDIRNRDGNICLNPGCNGINPHNLVIHHIDYDKRNCGPTNLITICNSCNSSANKDRHWHTAWYQAVIYRRCRRL